MPYHCVSLEGDTALGISASHHRYNGPDLALPYSTLPCVCLVASYCGASAQRCQPIRFVDVRTDSLHQLPGLDCFRGLRVLPVPDT